jgi:glycerophosphoryl diester phosphodiesterase
MLDRLLPTAATALAAATAVPIPANAATIPTNAVPCTATIPAGAEAIRATVATRAKDVAHRGASAYAPENTLAAFRAAKARRADFFELDVQLTRDGHLIIMHDATLARTTNARRVYPHRSPWRIKDFTLAQIKRLDAGSWFSPRFEGERAPTLDETLKAMDHSGLGLVLELKNPKLYPGMTAKVVKALRRHPDWLKPGRLIVHSFDWSAARRFHSLMPKVPVALLGAPTTKQLKDVVRYAKQIDVPKAKATKAYVAQLHRHRLKVFVWTVDKAAQIRKFAGEHVDGIISDRPDLVRSVLAST